MDSFAVFSGGGLSIANTTETTIGGHDWITGNIGSNQDVFMQGNPVSGYPAQLDGSAYAGGNLEFGQQLTVGNSGGPQREVIANGLAEIDGQAVVYGNVYGNDVTLHQQTAIHGTVQYNNSYSPSTATVDGGASSPSTKSFNLISMPSFTPFSAGGPNQTISGNGASLTLAPNTYGTLTAANQNQTLTLSSGDYKFDAIDASSGGGFTLKIDLTSGNPINIYSLGNVTFAQHNTMLVKGAGTGGVYVPISQATNLWNLIYMETYGQFIMGGATDGSHNVWGGKLYASKFESGGSLPANAAVQIGQYTEWDGQILAFDSIAIDDHTRVTNVPEPGTLALLGLGALTLALGYRRNRR